MKTNSFRIFTAEVLILAMLSSTYVAPTYALWDENLLGLTVPPPAPAEYISCPSDHVATNEELASIIGITVDELVAMKRARSLTNESICQLPKARITRSLKKTKDPSKPSITGFMAWRNESLKSGASGTINTLNANNVNTERQALVVNDGPLVTSSSAPMPQGSGAIDKTKWFSLGPNNVSGRIITQFIDPDYPDTIWAGSAGGGLWKSTDNGNSWNPVADFPGNTAISAIQMDPHDHNIMYIGTGDRDNSWSGVRGNGIFKSTNRGETWVHVLSTNAEDNLWRIVTGIYIDPIHSGRFIVTGGYSGSLQSDDNMQTWTALSISGLENPAYGYWVSENPYNSGNVLINISENIYTSGDYGQTFTGTSRPGPYGRIELAYAKPNIITLSGTSVLPDRKQISLTNTSSNGDIRIDTLTLDITTGTDTVVSGEACLRPVGSINSCDAYEKHVIQNTGGQITFSGISLPYQTLSKNGGMSDFEIFLDTQNGGIVSGEINYNIDHIDYESNAELGTEYYINGKSFGSGIIYASVDENNGSLYRSSDLGLSWELISNPNIDGATLLGNQGWYGNAPWVNPMNPRHLIIGGVSLYESLDGGYNWKNLGAYEEINGFYTFATLAPGYQFSPHVDYHNIITDPRYPINGKVRVLFGTDGGIYSAEDITTVRQNGFKFLGNGLNVTQFYSIAGTGNIINAGAQDNGCNIFGGASSLNWLGYGCGDGTDSIVDPLGRYVYGGSQYGWLTRGVVSESRVGMGQMIPSIWNQDGRSTILQDDGAPFIPKFILDPNNPSRLLFGARSLWVSDNIDTENPYDIVFRKLGNPDSTEWGNSISAIAVAQQDSNRIWISKFNKVYYTLSGATTVSGEQVDWINATTSNLPQWRNITHIEIDYYNPNKVYITYGGYEGSNIWMTENNGVSWTDISSNLPKSPVYSIKQFRNNPNYLYVGTEAGLFSSENGGQSWTTTNEGPANSPVFDIEWYNDNTLLIATFGRGAWALDLNNLTIVPPPSVTLNGDVITSLSGSQVINHYKDPLKAFVQGNGTVFYTLDSSVPSATSSSVLSGDVIVVSGETMMISGIVIGTGNTLNLRSRDFAGNWSDMTKYEFKYKDTEYIKNITTNIQEPYRAKITFETPISLSGSLFYSTSSGNLSTGSGTELKTNGKTTESLTLTGLTANTRYYYQIQVGGTGSLGELSPLSSFTTLNTTFAPDTPLIGNDHSGSLSSSGKVYMVGSTATGVSTMGISSGSLELIDTGSVITARIPLFGLSITSSGTWDGTLNAPIKIRSATGIQLQSGSMLIDSIYSIGNSTASLSLSGQVATISLSIYGANGTTIKIYRSPDILTRFTEIASCVVANNLCTFTTDHFSLFAIGNPTTIGVSPILGGNGGGGSSVSYGSSSANIILTPLQIQYAKDATTKTPIKNVEGSGTIEKFVMNLSKKGMLLSLLSQIDYSSQSLKPLTLAYSTIVKPILASIENNNYSRNQKLIAYDQSIVTLQKRIKTGVGAQERLTLMIALQEITKERKLFIKKEFSR